MSPDAQNQEGQNATAEASAQATFRAQPHASYPNVTREPDIPVEVDSIFPESAKPTPASDPATSEPASSSQEQTLPDTGNDETLSFAEMLAQHERDAAPRLHLSPGQRVSVRIVAVTAETVFVSTGSKVDGIVDREELESNGEFPLQVGDMLDLYVVTVSPQEIKLSRIVRGAASATALEEAKEAGLPVEGKITGVVKGGYAVEIMKRRAFCPASQIDLRPPATPETPVGKIFPFLLTRLEKGGRNIVVSRRVLLEREQAESYEALLATIQEGDELEATITRLTPFGAFAELAPGVEGLVHLSELSWSRIGSADEVVSAGDKVRVKVIGIRQEDKGTRISLSTKQVTGDPWQDAPSRLQAGDIVSGKVVRNAPFGAFVEVLPGVEGLVHLSELSYERRIAKANEVVAPGDIVSVKIKEIDPDRRRISLSLRDAMGNPWDMVQETLTVDAELTGTMERRTSFGLFIMLSPGITGLMPASVIRNSPSRNALDSLVPRSPVAVRVAEINTQDRRISLSPAGENGQTDAGEKDWKKHAPKHAPDPSIGALGLALQNALKKKK